MMSVTSVSVYEVVRGLELKSAHAQASRFLAWADRNEVICPDAEDFLTAARVAAAASRLGRSVELADSLIAAVAGRLRLPLVTGNTADYQAIQAKGFVLDLINWREPNADL